MPTFADALTEPWYVEFSGGEYLASTQDVDVKGHHYLRRVPFRSQASKFRFTVVTSDPSLVVVMTEHPSGKDVFVGEDEFVRIYGSFGIGTQFTLVPMGPTTFRMYAGEKGIASRVGRLQLVGWGSAPLRLAADPAPGPRSWQRKLATELVGQPALFGGHLFVAGHQPLLTCVNAITGHRVWEYETTSTASSPVAISWTERLAIVAAETAVHAVSVDTGRRKWTFQAPRQVVARPRAVGDRIFICALWGTVHAVLATTGAELWSLSKPLGTIETTPALGDGKLYVRTSEHVCALDPFTGAEKWRHSSRGQGAILAVDGALYFGDDSGRVTALRPDGTQIWQSPAVDTLVCSRPALSGDQLIAVTVSGRLWSFARDTGRQLWTRMLSGSVRADVTIADGMAYVPTREGKLHVCTLEPAGPKMSYTRDLSGWVEERGGIPISSGVARIGTAGGVVDTYCGGHEYALAEQDLTMLLTASEAANWYLNGEVKARPPDAGLNGLVSSDKAKRFGTAMGLTLRRPSSDEEIVVIAFGLDPTRAVPKESLVPVPAAIMGTQSETVRASSSIIDAYTSMRTLLVEQVSGLAGKTVMFTGFGLAAGFATLAAVDYHNHPSGAKSLVCVTFGAPPIGNAAFATAYERLVPASLRYFVPGDALAASVRDGWAHTGQPVTLGAGTAAPLVLGTTALYANVLHGMV